MLLRAAKVLAFPRCAGELARCRRTLAFERDGFIAKETAALICKFARLKAAHFELDPSEETRRWYVALSCCVQRANAKILRGEAVPGRGSSVPSRLLLDGRNDLALCVS